MNNYDRIKQMNIDEMAEWLSNTFDCNLCVENERLSDNPLLQYEKCDDNCIKHCKEWLESESQEYGRKNK